MVSPALADRLAIEHHETDELLKEYFRYMIPAQNLEEQVELLGIVKKSAPLPAYQATCSLAQDVLTAEEWNELMTALEAVV